MNELSDELNIITKEELYRLYELEREEHKKTKEDLEFWIKSHEYANDQCMIGIDIIHRLEKELHILEDALLDNRCWHIGVTDKDDFVIECKKNEDDWHLLNKHFESAKIRRGQ